MVTFWIDRKKLLFVKFSSARSASNWANRWEILFFLFDNKNIYDLLFSQSVVEFLKFPNILEVADNAFQTLLESVKDHDKSLNDLSASNKAVHIWSFLHGITSISKKMDVALALPDSEMPIPVRSIKRARDNLRQFIEDLFWKLLK